MATTYLDPEDISVPRFLANGSSFLREISSIYRHTATMTTTTKAREKAETQRPLYTIQSERFKKVIILFRKATKELNVRKGNYLEMKLTDHAIRANLLE